jgi:hypothetical protein
VHCWQHVRLLHISLTWLIMIHYDLDRTQMTTSHQIERRCLSRYLLSTVVRFQAINECFNQTMSRLCDYTFPILRPVHRPRIAIATLIHYGKKSQPILPLILRFRRLESTINLDNIQWYTPEVINKFNSP